MRRFRKITPSAAHSARRMGRAITELEVLYNIDYHPIRQISVHKRSPRIGEKTSDNGRGRYITGVTEAAMVWFMTVVAWLLL